MLLILSLNGLAAESMGYLVKDPVTNEIKKVENSAMTRGACKKGECEKNYIYRSMFSSKPKPVTPEPAPSPSPIAIPFAPVPVPSGEKTDYSKESVHMPVAWKYTQGKPTVLVSIIDSGIDENHADLKAALVPGFDFVTGQKQVKDESGHGSHCAGVIAAQLNGFGTYGSAPMVKIQPLRFLDKNGSGDTLAAIKAFDLAMASGADVISASWGGGGYSSFLHAKIKEATSKGIIVVFASGNASQNVDKTPSYPGSLPEVISVASSTPNKNLSSFSNYGKTVTIAAPGTAIYSTYKSGGYQNLNGTSMATPMIAATMALGKSIDKSLTTEKAKQLLCATSQPFAAGKTKCGLIDASKFISAVALDAK